MKSNPHNIKDLLMYLEGRTFDLFDWPYLNIIAILSEPSSSKCLYEARAFFVKTLELGLDGVQLGVVDIGAVVAKFFLKNKNWGTDRRFRGTDWGSLVQGPTS